MLPGPWPFALGQGPRNERHKERFMKMFMLLALLGLSSPSAWATPSTTYWIPCTIDIQPFKVGHVTYDNYTTLGKKGPSRGGQAFPNDLGLTAGVLPFEKFQMEAGLDWLEPTD